MNPSYDRAIPFHRAFPDPSPVDHAVDAGVRSAINHVINAARPDGTGMIQRPVIVGHDVQSDSPRDWRDGIIAAVRIRQAAHDKMIDTVRRARGDGMSWHDLAAAFGISERTSESDGIDAVVESVWAAFQKTLGNDAPFQWTSVRWECAGCCNSINDHGPFRGGPVEAEIGHAGDCPTFAATVAAHAATHQEQA